MRLVLTSWAWHSVLLAVAVVAGATVFAQRSRSRALVLAGAMAVVGVAYLTVGVVWWCSPTVGAWSSRLLALGVLVAIGVAAWRRSPVLARALHAVAAPVALMLSYALAVVGLGFLRGGAGLPADTAATRFSWRLPPDNVLPFLFARHVESSGHQTLPPPVSGWLSSDRPPLQTAITLAQTLVHRDDVGAMLDYQVLGTLLQASWILGAWAVLEVLAVRRVTSSVAIGAAAATSVVVLNTFYVWPKLLAAGFVLLALAVVLRRPGRRPALHYALAAVLAALAYLSHGGAVFALVPVAVIGAWQAFRAPRPALSLGSALAAFACVVLPWFAYQRLVDPPGDRLLKWMLADVQPVDPRSPVRAVLDQYQAVGLSGAIENKVGNLSRLLGHGWDRAAAIQNADAWDGSWLSFWRSETFYSLLPALGLLLLLAVGWAFPRRGDIADRRAGTALAVVLGGGLLFWCIVMFGPGTTYLHQGTFAFVLLGAMALACAGCALSVRFALLVVIAQVALTVAVLLPQLPAAGAPVTPGTPVLVSASAVLVLSLLAFVAVLVSTGRDPRPSAQPDAADEATLGALG